VNANLAECTVPEKILLAADQLEKQGQSPFSAEALIVAAWQQYPRTFGLKGYTDSYPDSNKILSSIMGEKGLARRGWLVKMGQKLYALTREGRQIIRSLLNEDAEPEGAGPNVQIGREQEKFILALLDSTAYQKFEENRKTELTFADATRFWGITENMRGDQLDARLSQFETTLSELERAVAAVDAELSNGRVLSASDVRVVTHCHRHLEDRFSRHLSLLRTRGGKK